MLLLYQQTELTPEWTKYFQVKDQKSLMLMIDLLRNSWNEFKISFEQRS